MGSFITDLKNSFNKGNIYIQFIYINVGVFIVTSLLGDFMDAVQPEWSICASIFGTAGLDVAVCQAALVFADLYVHACRHFAFAV